MKVLAVLVNYGTEQLHFLEQVVSELKSFKKYNVTVHVNTNVETGIDNIDSEAVIDLPNPQFLPLTCRDYMWEVKDYFDVFMYGENDHLFKEHHLDRYLEYVEILPDDRIAGLMQYETSPEGVWYPAYHASYEWDLNSLEVHGGKRFAHFTNLHQATFILTKRQVYKIGYIHDFTRQMGRSHYSVKCKVNTDIFQFCEMKKLICIDDFKDNTIHHLPDIYYHGKSGRMKLGSSEKRMQKALAKFDKI